jgi:hypothetical protein
VAYDPSVARVMDLPERMAQGVAERVVGLVVDTLDINALLSRIDVNSLLDRVDLDALVARIDLDTLVARIDLDALVARIDIDRLVARVDVARAMTTTATSAAEEVLGALRSAAARGDASTARLADRLIGRR